MYSAQGDSFSGGTGNTLGSLLAPLVFDHAVIAESRAQYVILDIGNFKVRLCLINVYAPNLPTPRHHVWIQLGKENYADLNWILGGDFNMTESGDDRSENYVGKAITERE